MDSAMNMNIDTLLEAAIFLEKRSTTRGSDRETTAGCGHDEDGSNHSLSPGEESRDRRRTGGAGTREVHNKLEKNRRAHLKECFEQLKQQIPSLDDKRTSNLSILRCSLRYIQMLKRKEKEFEQEMQRLAREKIDAQDRINTLKRELTALNLDVDITDIMSQTRDDDGDTDSTATACNESPIVSDVEEEDETDAPPRVTEEQDVDSPATPQPPAATPQPPAVNQPPVTSLPALQPPVSTPSSKQLAMTASTPVILTAGVCKVVGRAGSVTAVTSPSTLASSQLSTLASSQLMTAVAAVTTSSPSLSLVSQAGSVTASTTFKTPVNQLLQQTITQRALAQHQQQQHQQQLHQQQLQQQQLHQQQVRLQQPQAAANNVITAPTTKVITMARPVRPLTALRQAVTVNHLMPSLMTPGTSILAAPASQQVAAQQVASLATPGSQQVTALAAPASQQVTALAGLTKIQTPASSVASMSVASVSVAGTSAMTGTTVTSGTSSHTTTPVTFTAMKQILTTGGAALQVSTLPGFSQLVSQTVGRTVTPVTSPSFSQLVSQTVGRSVTSPAFSQLSVGRSVSSPAFSQLSVGRASNPATFSQLNLTRAPTFSQLSMTRSPTFSQLNVARAPATPTFSQLTVGRQSATPATPATVASLTHPPVITPMAGLMSPVTVVSPAGLQVTPNLSQAQLSQAQLSQAQLSQAQLSQAQLSQAQLSQAQLSQAQLSQAQLSQAQLSQAQLSQAQLSQAQLSQAQLSQAQLSQAQLSQAQLSQAQLSQAQLSHQPQLSQAQLSQAQLSQAQLSQAQLSHQPQLSPQLSHQLSHQVSVVNSPLLRSLQHIPIQLQQPINISQIVKPVVMVTVPSVVTTSAGTVQVQVPVTQS